jgi:hypothetical protein
LIKAVVVNDVRCDQRRLRVHPQGAGRLEFNLDFTRIGDGGIGPIKWRVRPGGTKPAGHAQQKRQACC